MAEFSFLKTASIKTVLFTNLFGNKSLFSTIWRFQHYIYFLKSQMIQGFNIRSYIFYFFQLLHVLDWFDVRALRPILLSLDTQKRPSFLERFKPIKLPKIIFESHEAIFRSKYGKGPTQKILKKKLKIHLCWFCSKSSKESKNKSGLSVRRLA